VPSFSIVTVTTAVDFGAIVVGTPAYDTNAELSAALAAPAVNARARNSPAGETRRSAGQPAPLTLETYMRTRNLNNP